MLERVGAVDESVACFGGLVGQQYLSDAGPERKRRVRRVGPAQREPGVAGRAQCCLFSEGRLIHRLIERVFIQIAVQRVGVNAPVVCSLRSAVSYPSGVDARQD